VDARREIERDLTRSAIISPMCGRYRLSRRKQIIEEHFDSVSGEEDWSPRYNIAPQPVPVIRQHPKEPVRDLSLMRWGLISSWSKGSSAAAGMINARSEHVQESNHWRIVLSHLPKAQITLLLGEDNGNTRRDARS
jgi:SOS response associated peptidase (SRAP)